MTRADIITEPTPPAGSPDWIAQRRTGIGGSDIAAFAGLSPWMTPDEAWLEKTGQIAPADLSANQAVKWGERLEAVIADAYAEETGSKVHRVNHTLRRADKPWMMAHVDRRIVGVPEGLEIKALGLHQLATGEWGEDGSDKIPTHYALQVGWYLAVTGYEAFRLAALFGGQDLRVYRIGYDTELVSQLEEIGERAWGWVQRRERPPISSVEDARRRFPRSFDRVVVANDEMALADERLRENALNLKSFEAAIEADKTAIMAFMGDADTLVAPDGKTRLRTWKSQEATRIDIDALRKSAPIIAAQFSVTSSTRVFREVKLK